jgi:arylsulfatase A-like enzyme
MSRRPHSNSAATSLWFRLITLAIVALVFCEALVLLRGKAQGWTFYLTPSEVAFEVLVRLVAAALAGMALGTICTMVIAPLFLYYKSSRERLVNWVTKVAVFLVLFLTSRYALEVLISWSYSWSTHRAIYDKLLLWGQFLAFTVALGIPRTRNAVVTSLDGYLSDKMTRRTALATVIGTAALVATEFALGKRASAVVTELISERPKSNFVLITFDALAAEDMSLYGRSLPTTPNIDAFARKSTVFTKFFAASTYTTPCIGVMLTGHYPSESRVYGLSGQLPAENAGKTLPHLMRAAGYATGAFLTNPWAYYLSNSVKSGFDILPEPVFQPGTVQHLWDATTPLHQDSGFGSRIDEYLDLDVVWNSLAGLPSNLPFRFRPVASFEHARQVLAQLPDGFFLWIHVLPPHAPYLPDPEDQGRFLPEAELATFDDENFRWYPRYQPDQQSQVDRRRLAYDEFLVSADRAFGDFMTHLENTGKLSNTTVIVSADHGESFEGGVYQHQTPYLTRPVIHIPLIVRTPGQQDGRTIAFTADQTTLAPTILELAGQPKPDWMKGQSLVSWLDRNGQGQSQGLAFTQYLERNSIFKPLRHGSVGVIDGEYEYVFYLDTQKGELRPLSEAQIWNLDRSAEFPARADALRAAIFARFPQVVRRAA